MPCLAACSLWRAVARPPRFIPAARRQPLSRARPAPELVRLTGGGAGRPPLCAHPYGRAAAGPWGSVRLASAWLICVVLPFDGAMAAAVAASSLDRVCGCSGLPIAEATPASFLAETPSPGSAGCRSPRPRRPRPWPKRPRPAAPGCRSPRPRRPRSWRPRPVPAAPAGRPRSLWCRRASRTSRRHRSACRDRWPQRPREPVRRGEPQGSWGRERRADALRIAWCLLEPRLLSVSEGSRESSGAFCIGCHSAQRRVSSHSEGRHTTGSRARTRSSGSKIARVVAGAGVDAVGERSPVGMTSLRRPPNLAVAGRPRHRARPRTRRCDGPSYSPSEAASRAFERSRKSSCRTTRPRRSLKSWNTGSLTATPLPDPRPLC